MDKWKQSELERMKAGGNRVARQFLEKRFAPGTYSNFSQRWNSVPAALLRDKVLNLVARASTN